MNRIFVELLLASAWSEDYAHPSLPPCPKDTSVVWTNCVGTLTFDDGSEYSGTFRNDKFHGSGMYSFPSGTKYVGEYRDGKRNGSGAFTFSDGSQYIGEWQNGKRQGQGTLTYPSGKKYVGGWDDDRQSGQGKVISASGFTVVDGSWLNDQTVSVMNTQWYYATSTDDDSHHFFVSMQSIRREGSFRRAWILVGYSSPDSRNKTLSIKSMEKFDCTDERHLQMTASSYSDAFGRGQVVDSFASSEWQYVVPDSVFSFVMAYVCNYKTPSTK